MATQIGEGKSLTELVISWEALPESFQLEDEPVENTSQPILAGALLLKFQFSGLYFYELESKLFDLFENFRRCDDFL
jgi:hypothetical protein